MSNNVKLYYNYFYVDPTDSKIFYIGKGTAKRSTSHLDNVIKHKVPNSRNYLLYKKIKELLAIGKTPIIIITNYTENEQEAYNKERDLIEKAREENQPLCNMREGGEGFTTKELKKLWSNEEYKEKLKKIKKTQCSTPKFRSKMSQVSKEYNNRPEVKEKHIARMKEKWINPQYKKEVSEKISKALVGNPKVIEARKKNWQNSEFRTKILFSINKPELLQNLSEKRKKLWQDPEYRAKMKTTRNDPDHKKRTSEIRKAFWRDPIYRAKSHESQRLARIKKKELREVI